MSICSIIRGVEKAFCSRAPWSAAQPETCPLREAHSAVGVQILEISESQRLGTGSGSPWKFWRRLSTRHRGDPRPKVKHDKQDSALLEKTDALQNSDGLLTSHTSLTSSPLTRPLPDLVEKTQGSPPANSALPPPKPPRLYLFRSPANDPSGTDTSDNPNSGSDSEHTYMNCDFLKRLKPRAGSLTSNGQVASKAETMGENNNVLDKTVTDNCREGPEVTKNGSPDIDGKNNNNAESSSTNGKTRAAFRNGSFANGGRGYISSTTPRKPKIVTPELSIRRATRARKKSSDKGEVSRQKLVMNSIAELLCQRLDPFPLIEQMKKAGALTNMDVQALLGLHDRKSVCEGLANMVGDGNRELLQSFTEVMAAHGNCTEILEILQVMREMDRIIHDIPLQTADDSQVLADEKNVNYDIGYLTHDHSLKPLVELERVRATGDNGKRLSRASCRTSAYSLLEGSEADAGRGGDGGGVIPGLIMMNVSVTGHTLSGKRMQALAEVIKHHNCISELHVGKTQLAGQDVRVLTQALASNSTIHSLDLRLNNIDAEGAEAVAGLLQTSRFLRKLNLSSTGIDQQSFQTVIAAVSSNKTLLELDVSFLDVGDESCGCLKDMLRANTCLQKVRLRSNFITWSGCYIMCEGLSRNMTLTTLDLSRNSIGDAGVQALAQFLPESSVSSMCLENCAISPNGCEALSEMISHCKKLVLLDVSTNTLEDAGIFKLAASLERSSSLMGLSMNMCAVTNDGFSKLLDVLEKNTSITQLKLCYNHLGREHTNPQADSDNLRYRLRIVTSSNPKLKILLWGNAFDES